MCPTFSAICDFVIPVNHEHKQANHYVEHSPEKHEIDNMLVSKCQNEINKAFMFCICFGENQLHV